MGRKTVVRLLGSFMAVCFMLALLPVISPPALAAAYDLEVYVNQATGDDTTGDNAGAPFKTIGGAIAYVQGQSATDPAIYIAAGTYTENLTITQSMSLIGASAASTIIDGGGTDRVINITGSGSNVTVENLTIQNGKAPDGATGDGVVQNPAPNFDGYNGESGGGIYCAGSLTVTNCTVSGCAAGAGGDGGDATAGGGLGGDGGNGGNGGGIYCAGSLTVTGSTISGNNAGGGGNGYTNNTHNGGDGGKGGGVYCTGPMIMTDSTVSGNHSGGGGNNEHGNSGNGGAGGGIFCADSLTVTNSTIHNNDAGNGQHAESAVSPGNGGSGGKGGGVYCTGALSVTGSAISDNNSGDGGDGGDGNNNSTNGGSGGSGGGAYCVSAASMAGNRILGNMAGSGGDGKGGGSDGSDGSGAQLLAAAGSADNNWWGTNSGPGPDDTNMTVSKWLMFGIAVSNDTVSVNTTTGVTVSLAENNMGEAVQSVFSGGNVSFGVTNGSVTPSSVTVSAGSAAAVYTAPASAGTDTITATLDNQDVTASVSVELIGISENSFSMIGNKYQQFTLTPVNTQGTLSWSATGLPGGLSIDADTGVVSGTPTISGNVTVAVTLSDARAGSTLTVTKNIIIHVRTASGNGAYLVTPAADAAYTAGLADSLIPTMTVNTGISGFTYFSANVSAVLGHGGEETAVFVHLRGGAQIGMSFVKADFESVSHIGAGFNVQPGDVVRVYIVDGLTNGGSGNPNIL